MSVLMDPGKHLRWGVTAYSGGGTNWRVMYSADVPKAEGDAADFEIP